MNKNLQTLFPKNNFNIKFNLSENADLYIGLRHPADMTSDDDFVALDYANVESVEM